MDTEGRGLTKSTEQLRLLGIFHYVVGGMHALFGCFGLLHLGVGLAMLVMPGSWNGAPESVPSFFPWIFVVSGGLWVLFGVGLGVLTALAGRFIAQRRRRTYCIVVAAMNCAMVPFGTVLGIFSLILLSREDVVADFQGAR